MKITIKSQIGNGEINEEIEFKGNETLEVYVQDNIEDALDVRGLPTIVALFSILKEDGELVVEADEELKELIREIEEGEEEKRIVY